MAFLTESMDSRNHVIVALSVTAGLIGSLLRFGLLEMLIGLVVALLILWGAVERIIDLVRSSVDKPVNLSHYGFWLQKVYEHAREAYLRDWMLSLLDQRKVRKRGDLAARVHQAFDFRNNPWMKSMGLDRELADGALIAKSLEELFSRGWVLDQEPLLISGVGREDLNKQGKTAGSDRGRELRLATRLRGSAATAPACDRVEPGRCRRLFQELRSGWSGDEFIRGGK
jgi:hypothetical protein